MLSATTEACLRIAAPVSEFGDEPASPRPKTFGWRTCRIVCYLKHQPLRAAHDCYTSCPIVTSSHAMLLGEFDDSLDMTPSFPLLDPAKPHRAYWYLKKYGLPFMYWNLMLKGLL